MLHCNGIDPFVTLMGNFNWGPISRNDIVSILTRCCIIKPKYTFFKTTTVIICEPNLFECSWYHGNIPLYKQLSHCHV